MPHQQLAYSSASQQHHHHQQQHQQQQQQQQQQHQQQQKQKHQQKQQQQYYYHQQQQQHQSQKHLIAKEFERILESEAPTTRLTLSSDHRYDHLEQDIGYDDDDLGEGDDNNGDRPTTPAGAAAGLRDYKNGGGLDQREGGLYGGMVGHSSQQQPDLQRTPSFPPRTHPFQPKMQSIVIQQPPYVQAPQKKEKKKKKMSFFGFGKKKASSSDDDQDVSSVVSATVSSQTTPYNNAPQAYGPAQQQQQQQQQQQPNNRYLDARPHYDFPQQQQKIIRRSIIIAEDEGRFGAPLLDVSEPGHPRRPESFLKDERLRDERLKEEGLRESYVRHARGVSYLGPPRMESLAGVRSAGSGSPERGGPSSRERNDQSGSTTTATQSASIGSPEASFRASVYEPQTGAPSLSAPPEVRIKTPSPIITNGAPNNTNYSTSSTSTTTPLIHIVRPTNLISPVHPSPDNTYLLSEDDFSDFTEEEWSDEYDSDDRDYGNDRGNAAGGGGRDRGWDDDDEEDGWMDIDEETLRNTEMNAVIPPHTITPTKYQTQTPREGAAKNGPQRHVGFSRITQECKGAYVDEDGRLLGYGSPFVWEGTLRGGSEGTDESGESGGEGGSGAGAAPMVFVRKSSLERGTGSGTNGTSRGQESATVGPKGGVMTPSSPAVVPTQQQPPYGTTMAATGLSTNHPNQAQAQTGQGGQSVVQLPHPQGPLPPPNVSQPPPPLQQPQQQQQQQQQPRRKKIRHVQIQTRPSVNAISTQTDFVTLEADPSTQAPAMDPPPHIAMAAESVTAMAAISSSSHAPAPEHASTIQELEEQLAEMHLLVQDHKRRITALTHQNTDLTQHTAQLEQQNADLTHRNADLTQHRAELEQQNADLTQQNTTLAQQNTTLTQEKTVRDRRLVDQQTRFDRLSKQAYMRIRQLVVERDAREVEVDVLRGVVGGS